MTLCDTGPLVALIDADDANHDRCVQALGALPPQPLLTTSPCLTEAMHLLGRAGGFSAQDELWTLIADDLVQIHLPDAGEWERMRTLMTKYADLPMDLGDDSLVAAAERLELYRILSLDCDFQIYRPQGTKSFDVVPELSAS